MSKWLLPTVLASILIDSCLTLRCLMHLEFIFVYGVREWSSFIPLHVDVQFSQHHLLKRLSFFHWMFSGCSILFHWSMCLILCQYHAVFVITALYYSSKSGIVMPSALFFLFNSALEIRGLFWFHTNFRIVCSSTLKNGTGILIGMALKV